MKVPIVTLTTDWGNEGLFIGMVKGRLYSLIDEVQVVDITHNLTPFDIREATFVAQHALSGFPKGTVHIIDVASSPTPQTPYVVVVSNEQYYICTDNGLPAQLFADRAEQVIQIEADGLMEFATFVARDLFCTVAAMICRGVDIGELGTPRTALNRRLQTGYVANSNQVDIYVLHTDNYGNAYLGMSYAEFEELRAGRRFEITVRGYYIQHLAHHYNDLQPNNPARQQLCLTVSATGMLELALSEGSFCQLVGVQTGDRVILRFKD